MIAYTDQTVKELLETTFQMPAIWTSETYALMSSADARFNKFPSSVLARIEKGGEIIFPFCAFIRGQGMLEDTRFSEPVARSGFLRSVEFNDGTRTYRVRLLPITYPYLVKYYCSEMSQAYYLEKRYYGLRVHPVLDVKFPLDAFFTEFKVQISSLDGFEVPNTDEVYAKGRYYAGAMGFSVLTYVADGIDVPLVRQVETYVYNENPQQYLDTWIEGKRPWSPEIFSGHGR